MSRDVASARYERDRCTWLSQALDELRARGSSSRIVLELSANDNGIPRAAQR